MKKYFLLITLFIGLQASFSQTSQTMCTVDVLNDLRTCLSGNGINFSFVYSGNSIYIAGRGNPPPGKIEACVAKYNHDSGDCPDAPVLINNPRF